MQSLTKKKPFSPKNVTFFEAINVSLISFALQTHETMQE